MPEFDRFAAGLGLAVALLAVQPASAATPQAIAERAVVQEGLAIGLASNVLQSQLEILIDVLAGTPLNTCNKLLTGGIGGTELTASKQVAKHVTQASVTVFYDTACTKPYIVADATVTDASFSDVAVVETATYNSLRGAKLGTLAVNESALLGTTTSKLIGTGTFTPAATGALTVSLGLQCEIPANNTPFPCTGGVAQDFPALNRSVGSLTELTLTVATKPPRPVSFSGNSTHLKTGAIGALSIGKAGGALVLEGQGTKFGTTSASGGAGGFTLFPPAPTGWTVSDAAHDVQFSVNVVSDTTRKLTGTVRAISTGTTLATVSLDRSGTGKISYGTGASHPITNWTLSD